MVSVEKFYIKNIFQLSHISDNFCRPDLTMKLNNMKMMYSSHLNANLSMFSSMKEDFSSAIWSSNNKSPKPLKRKQLCYIIILCALWPRRRCHHVYSVLIMHGSIGTHQPRQVMGSRVQFPSYFQIKQIPSTNIPGCLFWICFRVH